MDIVDLVHIIYKLTKVDAPIAILVNTIEENAHSPVGHLWITRAQQSLELAIIQHAIAIQIKLGKLSLDLCGLCGIL